MSAQDSVILDNHTQSIDALVLQAGPERGIDFYALDEGAVVNVNTKYSCYRLVAVEPERGRAIVTGGSLFFEPTAVRVEGATAGGSAIKAGWISVGLRLELSDGTRRITTSIVQSLSIEPSHLSIEPSQPSRVC